MDENGALALAIVPPAVYLILCFKLKSDTQVTIAAFMSVLYAFVMAGAALSIIGDIIVQDTFLTPSGLFLISMVLMYLITAVLHPQEFSLVIYGFVYFLSIPSGYLLLIIYSIVNMNNVSWGTRETGGKAKTAAVGAFRKVIQALGSKCSEETLVVENKALTEIPHAEASIEKESPLEDSISFDEKDTPWISHLQKKYDDLDESTLPTDECEFWKKLQKKYLEPLKESKEEQDRIADELRELRNKVTFVFFFCNALWLVATFFLQAIGDTVSIKIPKVYPNGTYSKTETFSLDPIALMFLLSFSTLLLMQFLAMLYHRIYTLLHFVAYADTEIKKYKKRARIAQRQEKQQKENKPETSFCIQNPSTHRGSITMI